MRRTDSQRNGKSNKHPKAVIYVRVSTKEQEKEGFSIDAQLKLLRDYANSKGFIVEDEYIDHESARSSGRTQFREMIKFLKRSSCNVVLVEKMDRLTRNMGDYVKMDELGVEIHFARERKTKTDATHPSDEFMFGIGVLLAKMAVDNLSRDTRRGMLEKASQGYWPSRAPLGYRNVEGPNGKKTLAKDDATAPMITKLFERCASGTMAIKEITEKALEEGLVFQKSRGALPTATVHRILHNPIYMGEFDWVGKRYQGVHEPLVSKGLWYKVQEVLGHRNNKKTAHKSKLDFAFSGLVTCGECGHILIGEIKKNRYIYYRCTRFKNECSTAYVPEHRLEELFSEIVHSLSFDEEVLAQVTRTIRNAHETEKEYHREVLSKLQSEYNKLQNRIDVMYEDRLDGRVSAEIFDKKAAEWRARQAKIRRDIENSEISNQSYIDAGCQLLEVASRAGELFDKQPPNEKKLFLNFVLSNCVLKDGRMIPEFRKPFDMIAETASAYKKKKAAGESTDGLDPILRPQRESNPCLRRERPVS